MSTLLESHMSLSDDLTTPPSAISYGRRGAQTASMISIPLSDISELISFDDEPAEPVAATVESEDDVFSPFQSAGQELHHEQEIHKDQKVSNTEEGIACGTPTARSPSKKHSKASKKPHHVRGKSSLQEPDMAALLARLELENNAIAKDPKAGIATVGAHTGPGSAFEYHVRNTVCSSLSLVAIPEEALGMSLGDFWAMVTKDYAEALQLLPTMTPLMIHKGVPDFLRSAVWVGIAGAWDPALQVEFDSLTQRLPYERPQNEVIINKDLSRCFPQHEMFKDPEGEGQKMLGVVLKAYSLYDTEIGYCQGMAFVAGVLLMNMPVKDAFCVFVKLMETHNLRTLYSPSLSGLHSRTYQLKKLMASISPDLLNHLTNLGLEPAYLSQWFMTIFATNCPFNALFRIYDVIFAEGADETIMRVALALILSNEHKLLAMTELEEVLHLLLGKNLWEPYRNQPDFLMDEIARLSNIVTREELDKLEAQFLAQTSGGSGEKAVRALGFSQGLGGFLGGWWGGSPSEKKSTLSPSETPGHAPRRSISKRSVTTIDSSVGSGSGADSLLSSDSSASTAMTEIEKDVERNSIKSSRTVRTEDRSLHEQVEGLLLALTEVQREAAQTAEQLRTEHRRKESMASIVWRLRDIVTQKEQEEIPAPPQQPDAAAVRKDRRKTMPSRVAVNHAEGILRELHRKSQAISSMARSVSLNNLGGVAPDDELQESLSRLCELLDSTDGTPPTGTPKSENGSFFGQPSSSRDQPQIVQPKRRDSVRLGVHARRPSERSGLKVTSEPFRNSSIVSTTSVYDQDDYEADSGEALEKWPESMYEDVAESPITEQPIAPRQSSLQARDIFRTAGDKPPSDEAILMELVNAKTREAHAIQQRDEIKTAMDKLQQQHDAMQQAHKTELEKLRKSITVVKSVPTLEIKPAPASDEGSLWPTASPSPRDPTAPAAKNTAAASSEAAGGWGWFSRSSTKQRSVSTSNASTGA